MIYYSHVNEDNNAERLYFQNHPSPNLVVIAGSGERVIALMDFDPLESITAVDNNAEALYLLQLKIALLKKFDTETYYKIVGHEHETPQSRLDAVESCMHMLTNDCKAYWTKHSTAIENGILFAGHFEKFLSRIRPWISFLLGSTFFKYIFELGYPLVGITSFKWKFVKFLFNFKFIYRIFGNKDDAFMGYGSQLSNISDALDKCLKEGSGKDNFMCHLIFKGHLRDMDIHALPPSLQNLILDKIRIRLLTGKIQLKFVDQDLLEFQIENRNSMPGFTFFSMSDILSFEDFDYLKRFLILVCDTKNAVVWRSFLRNELSSSALKIMNQQFGNVDILSKYDTTGMYKVYGLKFEHHRNES